MAITKNEIETYLQESKSIVLATVDEEGQPDLRSLGGYNFDGYTLFFGTSAQSNKVKQLSKNNKVNILVQHEGQVIPQYKNVTIYGVAEKLTGTDYETGKSKIQERRPNIEFDEKEKNIYKVTAKSVKILDFSANTGEQTTVINL